MPVTEQVPNEGDLPLHDSAPSQPPPTDPTKISNDESFGYRTKSILREAKSLTVDIGSHAYNTTSEVVRTEAKNVKEAFVVAGKEVASGAAYVAALALDAIAGDKEKGHTFADDLKKATPIIGATTKYAQAWQKFHTGRESGNEALVKEALVGVVIAFAEAGLDLSLLGAARRATAGAKIIGRGITWLTALRSTPPLEAVRVGAMERGADKILEYPRVEKVAYAFLNTIKPTSKKEEPKSEPATPS